MSYERGLSRKNFSRAACIKNNSCSQPLKLHFGLAVILRQTDGPEFGVCSPILRWSEEFSAENIVLLSKSEFRSHIAELLTTLPETSSSFAVGQRMPTMVLLEPRGLQLFQVMRGGIGFIWVLEAVISFRHTFGSDTHPRSLAQAGW